MIQHNSAMTATPSPPPPNANDEQEPTVAFAEDAKPPKEKLKSIMEAASALTSLGEEEDEENGEKVLETVASESHPTPLTEGTDESISAESIKKEEQKRYLPEHKKPDAAPTFPEKLMNMMRYAEEKGKTDPNFCIAWLPEGKSFVIRNPDEFSRQIVPIYFKATKFSSFTRKLYRWGFRQINRGIGPDDPIIFGNEFFDRDNEALMSKMRSVTAAGTRKIENGRSNFNYGKRPHEGIYNDIVGSDPKRMFFDSYMVQQKANLMHQNASLYGGMSTNGAMPMTNHPMRQGGMTMDGHPGHHPQVHPMMMGHAGHHHQGMGGGGSGGGQSNKQYEAMMQNQHFQQMQQMQHMAPHMMGGGPQNMYNMQHPQMQQQQQQQMNMSGHQQQQGGGMHMQGEVGMHGGNGMHSMQGMQSMQGSGMQGSDKQGSAGMHGNDMQGMNNGQVNASSHQTAVSNNSSSANMTPNSQGINQGGSAPNSAGSQGYNQSTAEIVNAAIAALRYSN